MKTLTLFFPVIRTTPHLQHRVQRRSTVSKYQVLEHLKHA